MRIAPPPRRRPAAETILPMINVVFLLLIFFLISARLTPPDPFPVTPPGSDNPARAEGGPVLFLSADGRIGYDGAEGNAALASLAADLAPDCADCDAPAITLSADAAAPALAVARLLPRLAALGFGRVELRVAPR